MPVTFQGSAHGMSLTMLNGVATLQTLFTYGWYWPATNGQEWVWAIGDALGSYGVRQDAADLVFFTDNATTDGQVSLGSNPFSTSGWNFLATLATFFNTGPVATVHHWVGTLRDPPAPLGSLSVSGAAGNFVAKTSLVIANSYNGAVSGGWRGDCAEFGFATVLRGAGIPPFFLAANNGTLDANAIELCYRRHVLPAWRGDWPTPHCMGGFIQSTTVGPSEWGKILFNNQTPVLHARQNDSNAAGAAPSRALAVMGSDACLRNHPRGRLHPAMHGARNLALRR